MSLDKDNPPVPVVTDAVRKVVVDCYSEMEHADPATVDASFEGGLPFDSIIGVEMAAQLEVMLSIHIPEEMLMRSSVYKSLGRFAALVQVCIDAEAKA